MDTSTLAEVVNAAMSFVFPVLAGAGALFGAKSNAAKSVVAHLSAFWWVKSLRRAGVPDEEIHALLTEAARKDLGR